MKRSRVIFAVIVAASMCIVLTGLLGNATASFFASLPTPVYVTIVVPPSLPPYVTITPQPTHTLPPTLPPLKTATPAPINPPEPTLAPVPTVAKVEARAASFSPITTESGALFLVGEVINTGDAPIDRPEVAITLYDNAGQVVGNERGFAIQDYVPPGQRAPVRVIFTAPPAGWIKYQVIFQPKPATSEAFLTYLDLAASNLSFAREPEQGYTISGMVRNTGPYPARYVQTIVTLYGAEGQVVGMGDGFANPDQLKPNGTAIFQVSIYNTAGEPASYRVQVVGSTR